MATLAATKVTIGKHSKCCQGIVRSARGGSETEIVFVLDIVLRYSREREPTIDAESETIYAGNAEKASGRFSGCA